MADMDREKSSMDRRSGLTRFFVPEASFRWYIRGVGLGALGIGAFFGALSWWYQRRLLDSFGVFDALSNPDLEQAVSEHAVYSLVITGVASVGTVLFVTLLSLYLLHRITGPIYRLKQHMLGIMMGRPATELTFRRDDQLADLSETFNEFLRHQRILEGRAHSASDPDAAEEDAEQLHARAEA
jgi:methyl-accepting chemotaxis protein